MLAVLGEAGSGPCAERIGAAAGLRQGISGHLLPGGDLRQPAGLLFRRAEEDDRQRADAGVRPEGGRPCAVAGLRFGHQHGGDLVESQASVLLGDVHAQQAQVAGLGEQLAQERVVLLLQPIDQRHHFASHELVAGAEELPLLSGEFFRRDERPGRDRLEEERAAVGSHVLGGNWKILDLLGHENLL